MECRTEEGKSLVGRRVGVALSGGVDSAVAAALLLEQGAVVVGLTLLMQKTDQPNDARRVADHLGIDHHVIDATERFSSCVMDSAYFSDLLLQKRKSGRSSLRYESRGK